MLLPRVFIALALVAPALVLCAGCATGGSTTDDGTELDANGPPPVFDAGTDANVPPFEDASDDVVVPPFDSGADGAPRVTERSTHALAGGATVSTSPSFKAIRTLGQSPGGNGTASSAKYKFHGGLVGATQ